MIFRSIFLALLLTTFINSILADTNDFWVGKWQVEGQDVDCDQGCCCPNGTLTANRDPSNTSTLLVTGTYTNSPVCTALGMTNGVYKVAWPFDVALWEGHFLYAANGEQFTVLALNKKTYADRDSIYADITIDDTKIENVDEPSFCFVTISKVYEASSAGLVKVSAAVLGVVMAMLYF